MISVLIPLYNTPFEYYKMCIDSIENQTFKKFEVLIIDNGSTEENIVKYKEYIDKKMRFKFYAISRQEGKKNLSVALNYGLGQSRYNLIARMDSDDIMDRYRLEKQYEYFQKNEVDILGGQLKIIGSEQITNHPKVVSKDLPIKTNWFINHPTVMFKKDKITEIGGYLDRPEYLAEDYELWTRSLKNGLVIHNLSDVLIEYRIHENNLTNIDKCNINYELLLQYIKQNYISWFMRG